MNKMRLTDGLFLFITEILVLILLPFRRKCVRVVGFKRLLRSWSIDISVSTSEIYADSDGNLLIFLLVLVVGTPSSSFLLYSPSARYVLTNLFIHMYSLYLRRSCKPWVPTTTTVYQ